LAAVALPSELVFFAGGLTTGDEHGQFMLLPAVT